MFCLRTTIDVLQEIGKYLEQRFLSIEDELNVHVHVNAPHNGDLAYNPANFFKQIRC